MKKFFCSLQLKTLLLWLFLAGLAFYFSPKKSSLSEKENILMEALLQNMIFEDDFGYTLFGNKPVSLTAYPLNSFFDSIDFFDSNVLKKSPIFPIVEAWSILKKNVLCHLKGNYVILKQIDNPISQHVLWIIMINKSRFLETVSEHLDLFCELLGKKITPKELLNEVTLNQRSLWNILNNEALYGILLGYGKENSLAFKRRLDLGQVFNSAFRKPHPSPPPFCPKPSKGFQSAEEEFLYLEKQCCSFDIQQSPLSPLMPPTFMTMKNDEKTKELTKEYKETFKQIIAIYAKGDFLSITLDRLNAEK
ncbi:MAG: hypothetical protein ACRCU0_03320 [Candidatus Rhabdochlamydia sp.]